jgi:hypothetical protein
MKKLVPGRFLFCLFVSFSVLPAAGGFGAEKEEEKKLEAKPKQKADYFTTNDHDGLRSSIGVSRVVVLVEVLKAGKVADDLARPTCFNNLDHGNMNSYYERQYGKALQRVQVKVIESFRGVTKGDILNVAVRHINIPSAMRVMNRRGIANRQKDDIRKEAKMKLNWKYLMVLTPDKTLKPLPGNKGTVYSTTFTVYSGLTTGAIKIARDLTTRIATYNEKKKPTQEQVAQARKLLAQLGANELQLRQAARSSLKKLGLPIGDVVKDFGQKTKDLEVRLQCRKILHDMTPLPGGIPIDWAGELVIK